MTEENIDRIVDLIYDTLNEFDISDLDCIDYNELADIWINLVHKHSGDETSIKEGLKKFLKGE